MCFFKKILIIIMIFSWRVEGDSFRGVSDIESFNVMTGPPSHGDYIICWSGNIQVVLSGGLCSTTKKSVGKKSWGFVNNNEIKSVYDKLLEYKRPVDCGGLYDKYYMIGVSDGCMISTSNTTVIEKIKSMISDSWDIDNKLVKSSAVGKIAVKVVPYLLQLNMLIR